MAEGQGTSKIGKAVYAKPTRVRHRTSIGGRFAPKNKHQRRQFKRCRGQGR